MTIKLDSTQISTVVSCTDCPWWRAFAFSKLQGWETGARHEKAVHQGSTQAQDALTSLKARQLAK